MFRLSTALLALFSLVFTLPAQATQFITYVASNGNDANTTYSCAYQAYPCRTFATALTQTSDGGMIVALDGSNYGQVVIDRSVTITTNPGVTAIIPASYGMAGVSIATPGVNVVLRGLAIFGQGAVYGVRMTGGSSLLIENCAITNFAGGAGFEVTVPAKVSIVNSLFRGNYYSISLMNGVTATISETRVYDSIGISADNTAAGTTTKVVVRDTAVSGSAAGGITAGASAGNTLVTVSNSVVTNNAVGLYQYANPGTTVVLESLGNNTIRQNGVDLSGTITTVSPK